MTQMDLFGNPMQTSSAVHIMPKISWSYSKMQAFRDCPRRFYFQYYGSKKRNAKSEILKDQLIALSRLSNKAMVQGAFIHQLISIYLKKAKAGDVWDLQRLKGFSAKIVQETISYNEQLQTNKNIPAGPFPKPILKEMYYQQVNAGQLKGEMSENINTCLDAFLTNEKFAHLRTGGSGGDSRIEGNGSFDLNDQIEVDGKIDLAFLNTERLLIADWKTGKKEMQDTSLQLLVYVLWARQFTEWKFSSVEIQKAYLQSGELEHLEFSELHIERAKARIKQDVELLREMDEFGKEAVKEAFAMHVGNNCRNCPFEEICHSKIITHGN